MIVRTAIFFLTLSYSVFIGSAFSQSKPATDLAATTVTAPELKITKAESELNLLREQNKLITGFQNALLDTVLSALGGVFTLAALLAGFSWWTNNKSFEAEKIRLRDELNHQISTLDSRLKLMVETNRLETERSVVSKNEAHSNRLQIETTSVRDALVVMQNSIGKQIQTINSELMSLTKSFNEADKRDMTAIAELRNVEAHMWEMRDVPDNVLIAHSQALDAALLIKSDFYMKYCLGKLEAALNEKYLSKGKTIKAEIYNVIIPSLEKAKTLINDDSSRVIELLKKILDESNK